AQCGNKGQRSRSDTGMGRSSLRPGSRGASGDSCPEDLGRGGSPSRMTSIKGLLGQAFQSGLNSYGGRPPVRRSVGRQQQVMRGDSGRATVGEISSALEGVYGRYQATIRSISGVYAGEWEGDQGLLEC